MSDQSHNTTPTTQRIEVVSRAPNSHTLRNTAIAIGLGVTTVFAAMQAVNSFGGIGGLWKRFGPGEITTPVVGEQPDTAHATIRADTYKAVEFRTKCLAKVSVGVAIDALEPGTTGRIRIKDIRWASFLGCPSTISTQVVLQKNAKDEVVKVTYNGPGLLATQARTELTDRRNCVNLEPDDSKEKAAAKINKYDQEVAAGKNPKCDMGTNQSLRDQVTYSKIGGPISSLPDTVNVATQLAVGAYGSVNTASTRFNVEYKEQLKAELEEEFKAPAEVNITEEATIKAQEDAVKKDLISNNYAVAPIINEKTGAVEEGMIVTSKSGDVVTVRPRVVESGSLSLTRVGQ